MENEMNNDDKAAFKRGFWAGFGMSDAWDKGNMLATAIKFAVGLAAFGALLAFLTHAAQSAVAC
jgi:hypothetical protein